MKSLRKFCATFVLTLLLATGAFGDGIIYPGYIPTPTPTPTADPLTAGIIYPGSPAPVEETESEEQTAIDPTTEILSSLVKSLLGLF
jgi:hypothetical protein